MFIKKDKRKINDILREESGKLDTLKLSKRASEFEGGLRVICHENKIKAMKNLKVCSLSMLSLCSLLSLSALFSLLYLTPPLAPSPSRSNTHFSTKISIYDIEPEPLRQRYYISGGHRATSINAFGDDQPGVQQDQHPAYGVRISAVSD
jgi:hypothetical protein